MLSEYRKLLLTDSAITTMESERRRNPGGWMVIAVYEIWAFPQDES